MQLKSLGLKLKLFNEELDALPIWLLKNPIENKRLKLVEVSSIKRNNNIEMDLRFEAAAANELFENTKNDKDLMFQRFTGTLQLKDFNLDKVEGISIRNTKN